MPKPSLSIAIALTLLAGLSVPSETFETTSPGEAFGQALGPAEAPVTPATIHLLVSTVWEGRDLQGYNLDALREFRVRFSDVSVTHFLSPAYFTRSPESAAAAVAAVRSVMRPKDQIGVTLGGWQSVARAAGVGFRSDQTFWGEALRAVDCAADCGVDVPLTVYPDAELRQLVFTSVKTLEQQGFGTAHAGLVEGWVASPAVLEAMARSGIHFDFSAVAAEMLAYRARLFPLYGWVKALWPQVTPHAQPYELATPGGTITEIPQSMASLDYLPESEVMTIFKEYVDRAQREPDKDLVFPLVIYQETAKMTLPLLERSLQSMFAYASSHSVALAPMAIPGLELPPDRSLPAETTPSQPRRQEPPRELPGPPSPQGPPAAGFPMVH